MALLTAHDGSRELVTVAEDNDLEVVWINSRGGSGGRVGADQSGDGAQGWELGAGVGVGRGGIVDGRTHQVLCIGLDMSVKALQQLHAGRRTKDLLAQVAQVARHVCWCSGRAFEWLCLRERWVEGGLLSVSELLLAWVRGKSEVEGDDHKALGAKVCFEGACEDANTVNRVTSVQTLAKLKPSFG